MGEMVLRETNKMNEQSAGIALIGTGGVANMHAQGFQAQPRGKLIGAYSRNPTNVANFAAQYDDRRFCLGCRPQPDYLGG